MAFKNVIIRLHYASIDYDRLHIALNLLTSTCNLDLFFHELVLRCFLTGRIYFTLI